METVGYILDKFGFLPSLGSQRLYYYLFLQPKPVEHVDCRLRLRTLTSALKHLGRLEPQQWNPYLLIQWHRTVLNVFDVNSGTWSGNGLVSAVVVDPKWTPSTPIGAIIGGVVGGLLALALIIFVFVRRRRQGAKKSADSAKLARLNSDETKAAGFDQRYFQFGQYNQGYIQYDQGYQHTPTFIPPPPQPVTYRGDESHKVDDSAQSPTSTYVSPTSYRDSTSFPPASPESVLAKSVRLSVNQSPQYFPGGSVAVFDARSPTPLQ